MGVSAKIFDRVAKTIKGFLDVWASFFMIQAITEFRPLIGITEFFAGRGKHKLLLFIKRIQSGKIFSFKFIPENSERNKIFLF